MVKSEVKTKHHHLGINSLCTLNAGRRGHKRPHQRFPIMIHPQGGGGGWVLTYMGYIGMCRCEGYGFQAVYSRIAYINQWV